MDKNLTVEIFVPTLGSNGQKGAIGTGYPVGKELILTARHVLSPGDRDDDYPVQIRWRHPSLQEDEKDWVAIECIEWQSDGALDVALIRAKFPRAIDSWGFLTTSKPDDKMEWASEGFAKAGGKDEDTRRRVAMQGRTCSAGDADTQFELISSGPAAEDKLWKGASGSPVFVGRRIIGVIITCPENFNAARLRATPCWRLLKDAGFRAAIGYDDQQARREHYKAQVSHLLKKSTNAMQAIAAELTTASDELVGKESDSQAMYLADRLLELEIEPLIRAARKAQKSLQVQDLDIDAALVSQAIRVLLPGVYDFGVIEGMRSDMMDIGQGFLSLPVSIHTVAEIVMAGYDRREAEYRNPNRFPRGAYCLPLSPESGWDERGKAFQEAWDAHLANLFGDGAIDAWDTYMIGQFVDPAGSGRQRDREQQIIQANIELEYLAESEKKTHYFLFDFPDEASAREQVVRLIRTLKDRYPPVVFLNLDSDADLETEEKKRIRPLSDILSAENKDLP